MMNQNTAINIKPEFAPWQWLAINQPFCHFAMLCGISTGKTFTGAHFVIEQIIKRPELTGFIGANTYDQMNQATLRELFFWFEFYGIKYVIDKQPPKEWRAKTFKKHNNILTVYFNGRATTIFTRVLSNENPLRGIQFSWYWIDETRDTPQATHDVILSRMRESSYMKGLVTTTTAGEDWCYNRFVKRDDKSINSHPLMYGTMHVPTIKAVDYGIISPDFYATLEASYSEMMALQELWAKHVNVGGGRAYYSSGDHNKRRVAPWGDYEPNLNRPLVVGCDFNFSPAPCVWMVGQIGPNLIDPKTGMLFSEMVHWFDEISGVEMSTPQMTTQLLMRHPNYFYEIYGDASGDKGTTSNAGETDFNQMSDILTDSGAVFNIDVNQSNPRVKDRVENMNMLFKSFRGEIRQTYNPDTCPLFDEDCRQVGWKQNVGKNGKLDNGGEVKRTHATDGGGYAMFKKFPPTKRAYLIPSNVSPVMDKIDSVLNGRESYE